MIGGRTNSTDNGQTVKFDDYERTRWSEYAAFGETVATILRSAIGAAGGYRLQQVRSRAKGAASLRKKLEKRGAERGVDLVAADGLEEEIKDLAGCRVIFYTNSDVSQLINSGIIPENFEILETKLHHPRREAEDAAELYISNHYLVRLRQGRLALPEYATFAGMRCEIQIQTILNHAWAEMAHDTIYKEPELDSFGTRALASIKERMAKISRKYLVPAGYEFAKVAADFERLIKGEELFKGEALQAIVDAADNNERMEALETFAESVLPLYDDLSPEFPSILEALRDAAARSQEAGTKPISTPYGDLPAKTPEDVLRRIAKIIGDYRYVDPDAALDTLLDLYAGARDEEERKPIVEAARRLAKHELEVWRRAGPAAQILVVDALARLNESERKDTLSLVTAMLEETLGTEVSGSTSTSGTITLHRGPVRASSELTAMRAKATGMLRSLYAIAESDAERRSILSALDSATRPPSGSGYGPDLVADLMESVAVLIEFEAEIVGGMSWELRQTQETKVLRHARIHSNLPEDLVKLPGVASLQKRIAEAVASFRQAVDADAEYAIYKVLVGFEVVYPPSWESERFGYKEQQAYREAEIETMVAGLSSENSDEWHARIVRCASTQSNDLATFPMFSRFLERAAEEQPAVVLGWLEEVGDPLPRFIPSMLRGLQKSPRAADARALVIQWIDDGSWLGEIAWSERHSDPFDELILDAVTNKAIADDDRDAVRTAMSVAGTRFADHPGTLIDQVFMPALRHMAAKDDASWLGRGFSTWYHAELIEALDEEQASETLSAIVSVPEIDHGAAHVVAAIAKRWHQMVLDFFGTRQDIGDSDDRPASFSAVPFSIEDVLQTALAAYPEDFLASARKWFDGHRDLFEYYGGRLFARVFPDLPDAVAELLKDIIAGGDRDDIAFVAALLNGFEGSERIDPVVRAAIAQLDTGDEILQSVGRALLQSGVVTGEYGFVERHEQQLERVRTWLADENERVRAFAEEHIRYLERAIAAETRRAEASLAARRLEFGEDPAEE